MSGLFAFILMIITMGCSAEKEAGKNEIPPVGHESVRDTIDSLILLTSQIENKTEGEKIVLTETEYAILSVMLDIIDARCRVVVGRLQIMSMVDEKAVITSDELKGCGVSSDRIKDYMLRAKDGDTLDSR